MSIAETIIPPTNPTEALDFHLVERLRSQWDRLIPGDEEDRANLYAHCDELAAIHARLAALPPEPLSLADIHRKWRALADREQTLATLEDLLSVMARRRAAEEPVAELVAEALGRQLVQAEHERTDTAVESALDKIWKFEIQGVEDLCVFLDVAMGKYEIEVCEPTNPEIIDHLPYLAFIGRVVRGMLALAPDFEFLSFKPLFMNPDTAERLLVGEKNEEDGHSLAHAAE